VASETLFSNYFQSRFYTMADREHGTAKRLHFIQTFFAIAITNSALNPIKYAYNRQVGKNAGRRNTFFNFWFSVRLLFRL